MARFEARTVVLMLALASGLAQGHEFTARHRHWRAGCAGFLHVDGDGVRFDQKGAKKDRHNFAWKYADIQQLEVSDKGVIRVLSYHDRVSHAGQDQAYEFVLDGHPDMVPLARELRAKLDERFVSRLAETPATPLWTIAVKRLGAVRGTEGTLEVYADQVVYRSARVGASRTWRDSDLREVSSAGPYELTVETFEKKGRFEFQLKQRLDVARFEALWKRLNRPRGLELISTTDKERP